jgi:hypothetical protein
MEPNYLLHMDPYYLLNKMRQKEIERSVADEELAWRLQTKAGRARRNWLTAARCLLAGVLRMQPLPVAARALRSRSD